jgi:hypothetical protein
MKVMLRYYWLLLVLCVAGPVAAVAQKSSCTLAGTIEVKDGAPMAYTLMLDIVGERVSGTSVTRQDGFELRAKVRGMMNKEKRLLVIAETSSVDKLPDSMEMCFFNSVLKWKTKHGKYVFTGAYVGKNKSNDICAQGKVSMEVPMAGGVAFRKDTVAKMEAAADTIIVTDGQKITDGTEKHIEWASNTCTLEVWDGGVIDGDVVSVLVNGKEFLSKYTLGSEKKQVIIPVTEKVTTITILAVEEGNNAPNTAQIVLTDGDTQHKVTAYNKKGKTANIVISRK